MLSEYDIIALFCIIIMVLPLEYALKENVTK